MNDTVNGVPASWDDRFDETLEAIDAILEIGLEPDLSSLPGVSPAQRNELEGITSCLKLLKLAYASPGGLSLASGLSQHPQIPGYSVERELGQGGMGVVYLARQSSLDRPVALKVMGPSLRHTEEERRRFRMEAESAARLRHPHIIEIYDVGEAAGLPYLAMEYMDGGNLDELLRGQPLPATTAAEVAATLAGAIEHAHQHGVIHRDLKPINILLRRRTPTNDATDADTRRTRDFASFPTPAPRALADYLVKITDFGLAKRLDDDAGQTRTGAIVGTPSYMSPEQAEGLTRATGPAVDVYALGAILYELLTGRPPFQAPSLLETLEQVRTQEPVAPRSLQPSVPRDLETICLKCLEKSPQRRYQSARDVEEELTRFQEGRPIRARRAGAIERGVRWARRHRLVAALVIGIATTLILGSTTSLALMIDAKAEARRADKNADDAQKQALRADGLAQKASERAEAEIEARRQVERALYVNRIARADREWQAGDVRRVEQLLHECVPGQGEPDLRQWEWHYLNRRFHSALRVEEFPDLVTDVVFHPDGRRLIASTAGGDIRIFDFTTGKIEHTYRINARLASLAIHPLGKELAASGKLEDKSVFKIIDVANGEVRHDLSSPRTPFLEIAYSRDGNHLAAVDLQETVVWNTAKYTRAAKFAAGANELAWSPDGKLLATSRSTHAKDGSRIEITLRAFPEGTVQRSWQAHRREPGGLAFNAKGDVLAIGSADRSISLWEVDTGRALRKILVPPGSVSDIAFHPTENLLASIGWDRSVHLWDAETGELLRVYHGHKDSARLVKFSLDGRRIVSTGGMARTMRIWDATASTDYRKPVEAIPDSQERMPKALSPDGSKFAVARRLEPPNKSAQRFEVMLYDAVTGKRLATFQCGFQVGWLTFSPDFKLLLARGMGAKTWDVSTGEVVKTLPVSGYASTFTRDTRIYAVATTKGIQVHEVATGKLLHLFPVFTGPVHAIALDGQGGRLAAAGYVRGGGVVSEQHIKVWDLMEGKLVFSTKTEKVVRSLALDSAGKRLAASGHEHALRVWDIDKAKVLHQLDDLREPILHIEFLARDERILTADRDTIRLLDRDWNELLTLNADVSPLQSVQFVPERQAIIAVGDRGIAVWEGRPVD